MDPNLDMINNLRNEIEILKINLMQKEEALAVLIKDKQKTEVLNTPFVFNNLKLVFRKHTFLFKNKFQLSNDEIARFSRQIIMPDIGVSGQIKLKNSSVLIVGMGGLGCPAAQYLIGAGVGNVINNFLRV